MQNKRLSFLTNASYNTVGVLINSFCLWLTTLVVVRFSSDYANAGIWQLSISITNIFSIVAAFNLATFYVSDVNNEAHLKNYAGMQIVTCFFSIVACAVYAIACGYKGTLLYCVIIYMICRSFEAFAGLMFAVEQRNYRMDYVGISYAMKGIFGLLAFSAILYFTKNLILSVLMVTVVTLLVIVLYDIPNAKKFSVLELPFSVPQSIKKVFLKKCGISTLAIAAFIAINTVPRQFLEYVYDTESIGYYSTIAAPVVVLQVIAINFFIPLLRDVALYYKKNEFSRIYRVAIRIFALLAMLTVIGLLVAKFFGEVVYVFLYGKGIEQYCYLIYAVVGCVVMYTLCWACWNMLIVMRKTFVMLWLSLLALLIASVLSLPLINLMGINGVSFVIMFAYVTFFIGALAYIILTFRKLRRTVNE